MTSVSVLFTFHNRKEKTIKSIQTIENNLLDIRYIATDDGSTDGTSDEILNYLNGLGRHITILSGDGNLFWAGGMRMVMDHYIYTGQRRLARNLLRDVVGRYIGNEPDNVYALNEIQRKAALMRFELERGNVDAFAELFNEHWELSKMIDAGSTNTLIDQIFDAVDDLLAGKMVCGAGGGGFLQVVLKKDVTRQMLQERLKEVFSDTDINVWDCTLV